MSEFNWVAQDEDGEVRKYQKRPEPYENDLWWEKSRNHNVIIAVTDQTNPNWKDTCIDLSKNDYIIKYGKLMATRKHAELIHAWADGATIQRRDIKRWIDYADDETPAFCDPNVTLRIKPKTVRFRNYIDLDDGRVGVSDGPFPPNVKWIGD